LGDPTGPAAGWEPSKPQHTADRPGQIGHRQGGQANQTVAVAMPGVGQIEKPDIGVGKRCRIERCGRRQQAFIPGMTYYTRFRAPVGPVALLGEMG